MSLGFVGTVGLEGKGSMTILILAFHNMLGFFSRVKTFMVRKELIMDCFVMF